YGGMEALAGRTGVTVAGGDISASATFFIAITVIGRLPAGRGAILRSGARPGHALCVTGTLGGSTAGLAVLDDPAAAEGVAAAAADEAVRRHRRPEPRLAEGRLLGGAGATAMLDVSDGLGVDALRLARASGVRIDVDVGRIPIDPSATAVGQALARDPLRLAWAGGEDYELLVTLPPPTVDDVAATLPAGLTTIGRVTEGPPSVRTRSAGAAVELGDGGYMHHV
ncbi:MAG: thiamine-phosphate kinase, partial [Miltoncostaeaceae bacterium]